MRSGRTHPDGYPQSRFRPGRSGPCSREPERFRGILPREASVLRRKLRDLPIRHRLQRRYVHRAFLLAQNRPAAADRVDAPDGAYVSAPAFTTILEAAKVTGRIAGFSIGALKRHHNRRICIRGQRSERYESLAEPATSYSVLRARKDFPDQSSLGLMLTATNRRLTAEVQTLPDQAYTGGVDWDWRLGKTLQPERILGRQQHPGHPRGHRPPPDRQHTPVPEAGRRLPGL